MLKPFPNLESFFRTWKTFKNCSSTLCSKFLLIEEKLVINGIFWFLILSFLCWKFSKRNFKNVRVYPLSTSALNKVLVASKKLSCLVQILWNLRSCALTIPLKVCAGCKLCLFKENFYIQLACFWKLWTSEHCCIQRLYWVTVNFEF